MNTNNNETRLQAAIALFTAEVRAALDRQVNGNVCLTLHLADGQVKPKPELRTSQFPSI